MTPLKGRQAHSTMAGANRGRRVTPGRRVSLGRRREARTRRVFDGVVASYIRDISMRTASEVGQPLS